MPPLPTRTRSCTLAGALAFIVLIAAGCSHETVHPSMHDAAHGQNAQQASAPTHNAAAQPTTVNIQDDGSGWKRAPQMHAFYDMTVATFANGTNIDVDAYETKSFDIFREFARANHVSEQAMLDHLKLIPRQVVGIVKENPAVLKSYDSFWIAMVGPD
jgi:hypothetical protein